MKPSSSIRVHIYLPEEEQSKRSSFDSKLPPPKDKLPTNKSIVSSSYLERQRTVCISSLSSSYTQFLKQRDMDKCKKIVS
jgi:hypothetical protein